MCKKIFAPFGVIKHFKFFLLWGFIIILTLSGPVCDVLFQDVTIREYLNETGALYFSAIALTASFLITNIIDVLFEIIKQGKSPFVHYQLVSVVFIFIYVFVMIVLYLKKRDFFGLQIVLSFVGYGFAFYLYCVSCLSRVSDEMDKYAISYHTQNQQNVKKMESQGKKNSSKIKV